jgi:hypothetical protein
MSDVVNEIELTEAEKLHAEHLASIRTQWRAIVASIALDRSVLLKQIEEATKRLEQIEADLKTRMDQYPLIETDIKRLAEQIAVRNELDLNSETWSLDVNARTFRRT